MIDIIYSVLWHESPECFSDNIRNITYFNKGHSIKIIINSNLFIYDAFAKLYENDPITLFHPSPYNKVKYTYDVLEGHLQNFVYCKRNKITAKYFIPLASNCMFHKQVILPEIERNLLLLPDVKDISENIKHSEWHWPKFYENKKTVHILNNSGIYNFKGGQIEGFVIEYNIFNKIADYLNEHNIKELLTVHTSFEEILIPTLYSYFTNKGQYHICKVFWDIPGYTPTIDQIINTNEPCVKRVVLDINNPVRKWILDLRLFLL